ncbi:MAG: hypothetical protein AAF125_09275 [Chloroflexota bacterium]
MKHRSLNLTPGVVSITYQIEAPIRSQVNQEEIRQTATRLATITPSRPNQSGVIVNATCYPLQGPARLSDAYVYVTYHPQLSNVLTLQTYNSRANKSQQERDILLPTIFDAALAALHDAGRLPGGTLLVSGTVPSKSTPNDHKHSARTAYGVVKLAVADIPSLTDDQIRGAFEV